MGTTEKKLLGSVDDAENVLVTTDNRWFVGGSHGFYQIDPEGVMQPQKIPIAFDASPPSIDINKSFFFGITQYQHFIYANCTPDPKDPASPRYIMFMDMMHSPLSMVAIHQMTNESFFNGLGSDTNGNLYLADFGKLLPPMPGKLVKLTLSSPTTIASQTDWLTNIDGHPNGIKVSGDDLYFSEEPQYLIGTSHIRKVKINSDGTAGVLKTLHTGGIGEILDDIELVHDGLLITQASLIDSFYPPILHHSHLNQIIHINELGEKLHSTAGFPLSPPSAVKVAPDSAMSSPDLIITERTGEVTRLRQEWGLRQRH